MSDDALDITEQELIELVQKQNFTDRKRAPQQSFAVAKIVSGPNKGWASTMSDEFTPDQSKFMAGYMGRKTFTDVELLAMAALPDELLGKIVGAAQAGGINALYNPLFKLRDMVVRVRTGHLLDGILLLDSNPNATADKDALEVIALAYDAWTKKGKDLGDESGWIYDTTELNVLQKVETENYETWQSIGYEPVLRGLNYADALNDTALSAYREADSKNIALAVGLLAISLGKTILRKDGQSSAYKFFIKSLMETIIEYLETGGYSNVATEARSYLP